MEERSYKEHLLVTVWKQGGSCVSCDSLTIRHILHSCNHRATEVDGAQRVVTLTEGKKEDNGKTM